MSNLGYFLPVHGCVEGDRQFGCIDSLYYCTTGPLIGVLRVMVSIATPTVCTIDLFHGCVDGDRQLSCTYSLYYFTAGLIIGMLRVMSSMATLLF